MAGIYIHIPFCKSRCKYCDFYSTTRLTGHHAYIDAVINEWHRRKDELQEPIETIYIGGGTPSQLPAEEITRLLQAIGIATAIEITMEANPGDLTLPYLQAIRSAGVNRLSLGVQSFQDELLRLIGRRHNAQQAKEVIPLARQAGFDNLSVDLMYGLPGQTQSMLEDDITTLLSFAPEHISAYCLMYEEGTALTRMRDNGEIAEWDDDTLNSYYDMLCDTLIKSGYIHYEVSNFCLPERHSHHNSAYWNNTPYLGLGAAAHSYDGQTRSWNIANIEAYEHGLEGEVEHLTEEQKRLEAVMLGLRTNKGISAELVQGKPHVVQDLMRQGYIDKKGSCIIATRKGLHILNSIIAQLV